MANDEKSDPAEQPDESGEIEEPKISIGNLPSPPEIRFHKPAMLAKEEQKREREKLIGDSSSPAYKLGAGLSVALMFLANIVVGAMIGQYIDTKWTQCAPWGTLVFTLAGFGSGFMYLIRSLDSNQRGKKFK